MGKIIAAIVIVALGVLGYQMMQQPEAADTAMEQQADTQKADTAMEDGMTAMGDATTETAPAETTDIRPQEVSTGTMAADGAKEFTMTAYYDEKGVWFSLKEIRVKKGDKVRIKITNTKGMHDFTIDELGIAQELPLNKEVGVAFVAGEAGSFTYYCSKPGHKAKGQWGTLIVE